MSEEKATCRGCGKVLIGKPYYMGGAAYDPKTMERCPVNQYGGFVCSESCDIKACIELESSMPGAGNSRTLSCFSQSKIAINWH